MAILPPDQSSSLLKSKNFAYDESFKDYNQKKKSEIQALRQQQKEDRQKAKELKKNRTDNLNQSSDVISNNTPGDQKPEGINKFGPVINAQTKKIIGIVTPNALALAANYINLTDVCPSEQTTRNTLNQFNNIVKDINNTVEGINKVANISQLASTGVNTIQQISTALQTTIPIASAAAKTIPLVPGFVVSLLDDLDYVNNKLLYNCSISEIQIALKDRKVSGTNESLCEITGTGKKFAMVSLKAGGDSYRIGRMKGAFDILPDKQSFSGTPAQREKYYQWLQSQQSDEKPVEKDPRSVFTGGASVFPQNESINPIFEEIYIGKTLLTEIEFISSLKSSLNRISSKIGDLSAELTKGWSDFTQKVKNTIVKIFGNIEQKCQEDMNYARNQYSAMFNSWDNIEKETGVLSEARESDEELVKMTDSLKKNVAILIQQINRIQPDSLFSAINEKVRLIDNKNLFMVQLTGTTPEDDFPEMEILDSLGILDGLEYKSVPDEQSNR